MHLLGILQTHAYSESSYVTVRLLYQRGTVQYILKWLMLVTLQNAVLGSCNILFSIKMCTQITVIHTVNSTVCIGMQIIDF